MSSSLSPSTSASSHSERRQSGQVPCTTRRPRAHTLMHGKSGTNLKDRPRLARPACRENSLPKEVFETRFENPFKAISRGFGQRRDRADSTHDTSLAPRSQEPSPRRSVNLRVVLSSLRHSFSSAGSDDGTAISPGPSIASQSTTASSATDSSASSSSESEDYIRNGVPRTDPYGPPYFADAPTYASLRSGRSRVSSLSSFGGMSVAFSVGSSISAYGTAPGPVDNPSGNLSAAAAIADAARKERLRDAVDLESAEIPC